MTSGNVRGHVCRPGSRTAKATCGPATSERPGPLPPHQAESSRADGSAGRFRASRRRIPAPCGSAPPEAPVRRIGARIDEFPASCHELVDVAYRDPRRRGLDREPKGLWRSERGEFEQVRLPDVKNIGIQAVTRDGAGNLWISIVEEWRLSQDRGRAGRHSADVDGPPAGACGGPDRGRDGPNLAGLHRQPRRPARRRFTPALHREGRT